MKLAFKKANEEQMPQVASLAQKIWRLYYPPIIGEQKVEYMLGKFYSVDYLLSQIKAGHHFTLILENDQLVGFMSVEKIGDAKYMLHKLYTDPAIHGKSIGTKAFDYLVGELKDMDEMVLEVNRQNFKAINFYFKMGFTIQRVLDREVGGGFSMNAFVMTKKMKSAVPVGTVENSERL